MVSGSLMIFRDSLMSTRGIWMTILKGLVYQWYLDDYTDSLRSTSGFLMIIDQV